MNIKFYISNEKNNCHFGQFIIFTIEFNLYLSNKVVLTQLFLNSLKIILIQ